MEPENNLEECKANGCVIKMDLIIKGLTSLGAIILITVTELNAKITVSEIMPHFQCTDVPFVVVHLSRSKNEEQNYFKPNDCN